MAMFLASEIYWVMQPRLKVHIRNINIQSQLYAHLKNTTVQMICVCYVVVVPHAWSCIVLFTQHWVSDLLHTRASTLAFNSHNSRSFAVCLAVINSTFTISRNVLSPKCTIILLLDHCLLLAIYHTAPTYIHSQVVWNPERFWDTSWALNNGWKLQVNCLHYSIHIRCAIEHNTNVWAPYKIIMHTHTMVLYVTQILMQTRKSIDKNFIAHKLLLTRCLWLQEHSVDG